MQLAPHLSLVVPVHNELDNLKPLVAAIEAAMGTIPWELILVDDGSTDGSDGLIRELHTADARVRGVFFGKNQGQTAAISAGIRYAIAPLTATMDADLQNDPADLPAMLDALGENDAVVGWRRKRQDNFVRRFSSRFANAVRNKLSRDSIRDTGCSLKVFRTEAIQSLALFEGMHRFLPTLLRQRGYQVIEMPVGHFPRTAGVSKYGVRNRAWRAFKDLLAVRWMGTRQIHPPIVEVHPPAHSGEPLK